MTMAYPQNGPMTPGVRLPDASEVDRGIAAAFADDGPALTLHMLKAAINGGVNEITELAKTNLWR
jgi:hypothetical protein